MKTSYGQKNFMLIFTKRNDDKCREKYANNALKIFFPKLQRLVWKQLDLGWK